MTKELEKTNFKLVKTLNLNDYVNLMKRCEALVGNSSSGIHETNTFGVPTVNVGTRQNGRLRSKNIVDVSENSEEIIKGLSEAKNKKGKNFEKLYGNGDSAKKICELLAKIDLDKSVIQKQITY